MILFAAGLLTRTLSALQTIDLGFDPVRVVAMNVDPAMNGHTPDQIDTVLIQPPDERWTVVKRFNWPIDAIVDLITGQEYEAADRFRWAYEARIKHAKIGSYGGLGGSSDPARRLALTPDQQKAGLEWQMWDRRIPPAIRPILDNFVLELQRKGDKPPLSRVEFGKLYGRCKHEHQARGMSNGMLKVALGVLAAIWAEYQDWLETQRSHIRKAAENQRVRELIALGALDEAAREIQAETRIREAKAARGVAPIMALKFVESEHVRHQVFGKALEDKRART